MAIAHCAIERRKVAKRLKNAFTVGMVILFIAGIVWFMLGMVTSAADKIWLPIFKFFELGGYYTRSGIGSLILTVILAIVIGWLLTAKFFERKIFGKIPVFGQVWKWAKKISSRIDKEKLRGFTPVFFEYLIPGFQWIGFMSGIQKIKIMKSGMIIREKKVKLFVPNPPIPFTGQGFFVNHIKIIGKITNDFDDIINTIFSATFISPEELVIEEMPELNEENFKIEVEFINLASFSIVGFLKQESQQLKVRRYLIL